MREPGPTARAGTNKPSHFLTSMNSPSSLMPGQTARTPASHSHPHHHRLLGCLMALLTAVALPSCQTITPPTSAQESGHWHMVRNNPPTYFPKGIPADHPTGVNDGYWVSSGDARGTRYFIPSNGTGSPEALIAEAQATMTPAAKDELNRKRRESDVHDTIGGTIEITTRIAVAILSGVPY